MKIISLTEQAASGKMSLGNRYLKNRFNKRLRSWYSGQLAWGPGLRGGEAMLRRMICGLLWFAAAFLANGMAPDITGNVTGTVKDSTGAAVSGATVTVINADTDVVARKVATRDSGLYVVTFLPIGHYTITVEKSGFRKAATTGVQINAHDELTVNVELQVGSTQQEVTVVASAAHVELENAQAMGLIEERQIREIPLNNRNYEQLVNLQPGVSYGGGDQLYF